MKNFFTVKRMCRAGVIAALYVATTYAFGAIGYEGLFEIRPAEALTILPLFFPEAVPALWIGCMLANLASPFFFYDVILGALATLISALGTYAVGRLIRKEYAKNTFQKLVLNEYAKVGLGGAFPYFDKCLCHSRSNNFGRRRRRVFFNCDSVLDVFRISSDNRNSLGLRFGNPSLLHYLQT